MHPVPGILLGLLLSARFCPAASGAITLQSLLNEMADRDALARFPDPPYTSHQASSCDRRSIAPNKPGWFANNDWSQFIRSERHRDRTEWVMMEADGPGCVTRIWSGGPKPKGVMRFYLDDTDRPAIEMPAAELIGGKGLVGPPLSQITARGLNLYLPIPYARHCKITYDGPNFWQTHQEPDQIWYNIEYRSYSTGTETRTFQRDDLKEGGQLVQEVGSALLHGREMQLPPPETLRQTLKPGKGDQIEFEHGGVVRQIAMTISGQDLAATLRSTILILTFDGEQTVWCPVGDFFGSGVALNPFETHNRTARQNGDLKFGGPQSLESRWIMPFQKTCTLRVENLGNEPSKVSVWVFAVSRGTWDDRSMHFHATWHHQYPIQTKQADGTMDWNYVTIRGKGVYVGDALCVFNPVPDWWGEGDEKIWADGEKFPSHFGTGSEDFYGYAYGDPHLFSHPFHAQTRCDGPGNQGYTCVTRERSLDAIPFEKSLKVDLEIWHWKATQVGYAATSYWYARPGATAEPGPAPEEALRALPTIPVK